MIEFTKSELTFIQALMAAMRYGEHPLFIKIDDMLRNYCFCSEPTGMIINGDERAYCAECLKHIKI